MSYLSTPTLILGACVAFLFLPLFRARPLAYLLIVGGLAWAAYGQGTTGEVQPVFGGIGLFFLGLAKLSLAKKRGYAIRQPDMWGYIAAWVFFWSTGGVLDLWAMMQNQGAVLGSLVLLGSICLAISYMFFGGPPKFTGRFGDAGGE